MRPKPFSPSALDKFQTCPRQYYFTDVLREFRSEQGPEQIWGDRVHKHFEDYIRDGIPLPSELQEHAEYLSKLRQQPGKIDVELKAAMTIRQQPTGYYAKDVWWRGKVDYQHRDGDDVTIVDYKTGKMRPKPAQLHWYSLYAFACGAQQVTAKFYWTQFKTETKLVFPRVHAPKLFAGFKPLLLEYAEAFNKDIWQPRPSGLCRGWCPVTSCEYHGRGR